MAEAKLLITSKNYSSWSLRGWLLVRFSGLPFREERVATDNPAARAELLLQASSIRVPCLEHDGLAVWDTLAIAEYLHEIRPEAGLLPSDRAARARCRSVSGEMHSGFSALRSSLPMNLRAHRPGFHVWAGARADIDRIATIWRDCLREWGGPFLFGPAPNAADAMYAPVVTRLRSYDVRLDRTLEDYGDRILALPDMRAWTAAAAEEADETINELEIISGR
ncbi:glutathione S-transferase family protein [Roseomonas sp. BN140053]|uniref:glutathione S-transferase family protein n=1 Tax=Roseomonas sp. BN140053 TaxID=3391898 RepID=UPI0039E95115